MIKRLKTIGMTLVIIGVIVYTIGLMITPEPPSIDYIEGTEREFTKPVWPHISKGLSPIATIGFDIAVLGVVLTVIGVLAPRVSKRTKK
jgi:predicted membrane channel-forming protein YqfA (hemolysin III family)